MDSLVLIMWPHCMCSFLSHYSWISLLFNSLHWTHRRNHAWLPPPSSSASGLPNGIQTPFAPRRDCLHYSQKPWSQFTFQKNTCIHYILWDPLYHPVLYFTYWQNILWLSSHKCSSDIDKREWLSLPIFMEDAELKFLLTYYLLR